MSKGTSDVLGRMVDDDNRLKLKIKKLSEDAILPIRGTPDSAGYDVYSIEDATIPTQQSVQVHLGIAIEIPKGYVGLLFARSGLASKKHLRPSNCVGVVDSDYRGEVMVNLYNDTVPSTFGTVVSGMFPTLDSGEQIIKKGDRVAQLVILPYIAPELILCDELSDTPRGEGGFGSTDEKKG